MCVCVCMYTHTHTHTHRDKYIHTHTHTHIRVRTYCCMPTVTNMEMIRDLEVLSKKFNIRKFILTLLHKNKVKQQQQQLQICGPRDLCKQKDGCPSGSGFVMSSRRSIFISHQVTLKACKERSVLLFMLFM